MWKSLNKKDVLNFGKVILLSGFMTYLVTEQFKAEKGMLNVAAGGTGYQLETSGGKLRASELFHSLQELCTSMHSLLHS